MITVSTRIAIGVATVFVASSYVLALALMFAAGVGLMDFSIRRM
jgi:hypothetical protein